MHKRIIHESIVYKSTGIYSAFPILNHLDNDKIAIGFSKSLARDHTVIGEWTVLTSTDQGKTWENDKDINIPLNWPAPTIRERSDRTTVKLSDDIFVSAGTVGFEPRDISKKSDASSKGLYIYPHPWDPDLISVRNNTLFTNISTDGGKTWERQEWTVPGFKILMSFARGTRLSTGEVLIPVYGTDKNGRHHNFIWRSDSYCKNWQLVKVGSFESNLSLMGEMSFLETSPGNVLGLSRNEFGYFTQTWSSDLGKTWTYPVLTEIWAPHSPPDLIKLHDGSILCTYGYRRDPMGIKAVISQDNGQTWDIQNTAMLRKDGGYPTQSFKVDDTDFENLKISGPEFRKRLSAGIVSKAHMPETARPDLGYALSTQLSDNSIFSCYYITTSDRITHIACTLWEIT